MRHANANAMKNGKAYKHNVLRMQMRTGMRMRQLIGVNANANAIELTGDFGVHSQIGSRGDVPPTYIRMLHAAYNV